MKHITLAVFLWLLVTGCGTSPSSSPSPAATVPASSPSNHVLPEGQRPAIVVEAPAEGASVSSPVTVSGTANVYEGTVSIRILDEQGKVIASAFTTATCGTGCRGTFRKTVAFDVDQTQSGTIEVFEESAKNGRPTNVVSVPVVLTTEGGT